MPIIAYRDEAGVDVKLKISQENICLLKHHLNVSPSAALNKVTFEWWGKLNNTIISRFEPREGYVNKFLFAGDAEFSLNFDKGRIVISRCITASALYNTLTAQCKSKQRPKDSCLTYTLQCQ